MRWSVSLSLERRSIMDSRSVKRGESGQTILLSQSIDTTLSQSIVSMYVCVAIQLCSQQHD